MKLVYKHQVLAHQNSMTCTAFEYPFNDPDINGAVVQLNGRYPANGCATNELCKEMAYVISGSVKIVIEGKEMVLIQGDVILILPGEKFFWDGMITMFISCSPAWYPEQHKYVD